MFLKKLYHFFVLFLFASFSVSSYAQEKAGFKWAVRMGGTSSESGRGVAIDNAGNVITAGFFSGTADFDPGTLVFNLISAGSNDAFVTKLDANGNFIWALRVGSTGNEIAYGVKTDASGNIYVTGEFTGTVDFDPSVAGAFPLASAGSVDGFILKLDQDGNFIWAKRIGSTGVDRPASLSLDPAGDVYTTGVFSGTVDFDPGTATSNLTAVGPFESFVLKIDANGNFIWAAKLGTNTATREITSDAGNAYVTGDFSGTADFDPAGATFNMTAAGPLDIFVTKLTIAGAFVWAKQMGGTDVETGETIAVDATGNVYTSGGYMGTADFDPGAATFNYTATSASIYDIFISKLDVNGNFVWAKSIGSTGADYGGCLVSAPSGDIYLASEFQGTVDFDPGANYKTLTAAGSSDIVIQKLSAAGNYVWSASMGGTNSEFPHGMTLDLSGNTITTGFFNNTADFDPTAKVANLTATLNEIFVVRLSSEATNTLGNSFDTFPENWITVTAVGSPTPIYSATGGNPGGMIGAQDLPAGASLPLSYFRAPPGFIGNLCSAYGKTLTYDIQQTTARAYVAAPNVIISNGSITLEYRPAVQVYPAVEPGWTTYTVPLIEGPEWLNASSGSQATRDEMKSVLCAVTRLDIRGRYGSTPDGIGRLDNPAIEKLSTSPPPVITSFTPASAIAETTLTITGTGFDPTPANNTVFFGAIQATVSSASATQLQVTVPKGARYGTITVLNNTTSLIGQSLQNFDPAFTDGGRIIPASLGIRQEINLTASASNVVSGLNLTDLDNDGWVDIIVSESLGGISIYRNLGSGGTLTGASFAPKITLTSASRKLRIGDIDGDEKQDIAVLYSATFGYVTLYRNTSTPGAISFAIDDMLESPSFNIRDIELVDLDDDGRLDLLESFFDGCSIGGFAFGVWQGISEPGNIEFCAYKNFDQEVFCQSNEITIGDFNNDKKIDVAVASFDNSQIHILQNTSTYGVVAFGLPFPVTATNVVRGRVQAADFNGDGKLDLAWRSNTTNDVRIRTNSNTGGALAAGDFSAELILQSGLTGTATSEGELSIADINGDGKPELLGTDDTDFGIFENLHSGGALTINSFNFYKYQGPAGFTRPAAPETADLNGDSRPDIVFGTLSAGTAPKLVIFENINAHTPTISITTVSPLKGPVGGTVTITGDYFSTTPSQNNVYFGPAKATVLTATKNILTVSVPAGATHAPVSVTVNELTAQYHLPFNVAFSLGNTFSASSFGAPVNFSLTSAELDLDVADLNGDNKPDVVAEGLNNDTYIFRNTHSTPNISASSLMADGSVLIADGKLVDLNGDSKPDLYGEVSIFRNSHISGNAITFDAGITIGSTALTGSADLNLDGRPEIVGTNGSTGSAHENQSRLGGFTSGAFTTMSSSANYAKASAGGYTVTADFNNDGFVDMASTNPTTDNFTVLKSNGGIRVTPALMTASGDVLTGDLPQRIYSGDLDVDGKMDLVVIYGSTGISGTLVSVFHNQSTASTIVFSGHDFTLSSLAGPSTIADLDGDGKPEIIVTHQGANTFTILKNISVPGTIDATSFTPAVLSITAPRAVAAGDINSDGKLDLIFTGAPNTLAVLENLMPSAVIAFSVQPSPATTCQGNNASFSVTAGGDNNLQYQWQIDNAGFVNLSNDATYSGVNTSTLTITGSTIAMNGNVYRVLVRGDVTTDTPSGTAALNVNTLPAPPTGTGAASCGAAAVTLTAAGTSNGNYRWYNVAAGGTALPGEVNSSFTTPLLTTTTPYYAAINNSICESTRTIVTASIHVIPSQPVITSSITPSGNVVALCDNTVTFTAPAGFSSYQWSTSETTQQIVVSQAGSYSLQVTDANGCTSISSAAIDVIILTTICNTPPAIESDTVFIHIEQNVTVNLLDFISDSDDDLDFATLRIVSQPESGAVAEIVNNTLIIHYEDHPFSGTDRVIIEICDLAGNCTQEEITIEVIGDIEVFNAVSPNNDGKNDFLFLQYIEVFESTEKNRVSVYNRWGDVVYEATNYDNQDVRFEGRNNNGNDLPSGTYFYKIEFFGTPKRGIKTGYFSLKR